MDLDLAAMMVANLRSGNPNQILKIGGLAQLVERLLCKQEVSGSIPLSSTMAGGRGLRSEGRVTGHHF